MHGKISAEDLMTNDDFDPTDFLAAVRRQQRDTENCRRLAEDLCRRGVVDPFLLDLGGGRRDLIDVTDHIIGLLRANGGIRQHVPTDQSASTFLTTGRTKAREIGVRLNALGGWDAMSAVFEVLGLYLHRHAGAELSHAWDGIGQWRA
jgi:hypothetical protein